MNGCTSAPSDPIEVFVNTKPQIGILTITNPSTWCVNDGIITLTGLLAGEVYTIRFNNGSIADSIIGLSSPTGLFEITGCTPTTYFNISAERNGCRSDNIVAPVGDPVSPAVPLIAANDDTICPGQTVVLSATGCNGTVTWSDGSTGATLTISPGTSNSYSATCTESSCSSASSNPVTVIVETYNIAAIEGNKYYCVAGQIVLNAVGNAITYQWILPDGTSEYIQNFEKENITINDGGFYILSVMDLLGCSDRDTIEVSVNTAPIISIAPSDTLCAGTQYVLSPGDGYPSYLWYDGSILASHTAMEEGEYWVKVTDANGCVLTSGVVLTYCPQDVYIPTAFSPNGNGTNELFVLVTGGNVLLDYTMIIYNRWGQKVFESNDYHIGWKGTLNGSESPSGLYTYLLMYKISDLKNQVAGELKKIRGTVTLVR
jgi:gliding motility-associated-like protein